MANPRYARNAGAVFSLKYHLVWCPKYRRPVLVGDVAARLKVLLTEKAAEMGATLHAMEVMPDHVHLFVESDPTRAPAHIAAQFKGYTSRVLRQEFGSLRSRLPTLWSRSYFASTVGHVSAATIKKYIETQWERA
jgi:putative transposase